MRMSRECPAAVVHWRRHACPFARASGCAVFFVFVFSSSGWGPETLQKSVLVISCQFLLTEARSAVSIMYDCGLRERTGVRFSQRIERKQRERERESLIVCKGENAMIKSCFSSHFPLRSQRKESSLCRNVKSIPSERCATTYRHRQTVRTVAH